MRKETSLLNKRRARDVALNILKKKRESKRCICPKECDCENPEPKSGVALVSNCCPIHSDPPQIELNCAATKHKNGAVDMSRKISTKSFL